MDHDQDREQQLARERLTRRYGTGKRVPLELLRSYAVLGEAVTVPGRERAAVTAQDVDDALALTGEARSLLDRIELYLIDEARAHGRSWAQIEAACEADQAHQRYEWLRERWPGYVPVQERPLLNSTGTDVERAHGDGAGERGGG
ncbi:hypothetical protein [Streptomyces armeniacus]|uniref:hypothetical protein n=1 Tax=Streptomyces armeniacus TaxID=83291 RepID=UPI001AD8432E|nr:hypothetical protein [Streptomyces armeniacus]